MASAGRQAHKGNPEQLSRTTSAGRGGGALRWMLKDTRSEMTGQRPCKVERMMVSMLFIPYLKKGICGLWNRLSVG
jgi:hypothetical protein